MPNEKDSVEAMRTLSWKVEFHLRTGDAECKQIARTEPIDSALGDSEILRSGS